MVFPSPKGTRHKFSLWIKKVYPFEKEPELIPFRRISVIKKFTIKLLCELAGKY